MSPIPDNPGNHCKTPLKAAPNPPPFDGAQNTRPVRSQELLQGFALSDALGAEAHTHLAESGASFLLLSILPLVSDLVVCVVDVVFILIKSWGDCTTMAWGTSPLGRLAPWRRGLKTSPGFASSNPFRPNLQAPQIRQHPVGGAGEQGGAQ